MIIYLQDDNESYQVAAKEALEKLHAEKLQAVALAVEHETAREAAEQKAQIANNHCEQTQLEFVVCKKLLLQLPNQTTRNFN